MTTQTLQTEIGLTDIARPAYWKSVEKAIAGHRERESGAPSAFAKETESAYARYLNDIKQCAECGLQVVRLVLEGKSDRQIADALEIGEDTVKRHLLHVYTKLGIHRRELILAGRYA